MRARAPQGIYDGGSLFILITLSSRTNKFCSERDLDNESSVEDFFILPLLKELGYRNENIRTKHSIEELTISGGGRKKEHFKPDFVIIVREKPCIVIEVKATNEDHSKYLYQAQGYSYALNLRYNNENPVKHFLISNGGLSELYKWDVNTPILSLSFDDFVDGNEKYEELKQYISYDEILKKRTPKPSGKLFNYFKPELHEIEGLFNACHNLIWKKEKIGPTEAFYKFTKLMFIKLDQDKRLRKDEHISKLLEDKKPIPLDDVIFNTNWIKKREKEGVKNPFNSILFYNLRNELESEVRRGIKKRIFEFDEQIGLKASTIIEIVKLLQHHDLHAIDADLNGTLFETFLEATIRGRELGQFFTPRTVVKFMTELSNLRIDYENKDTDRVLDACCGTGGFLIEAMALMSKKIESNLSLSHNEKIELINKVMTSRLYGIDASKTISRIARINMYLHGDGGSSIFEADALDKRISIEKSISDELKGELEELNKFLNVDKVRFDVVLTNPPFAMRYELKKEDEKQILEQYFLSKDSKGRKRASLKSNVMFLERYCDLLKPYGKLLTVIDESVLNTSTNKPFRDYIKEKFLIKAVISLPNNAFVNAGSNVKTSILYLVKKKYPDEPQPTTFMAISENIGHTDSGRRNRGLDDLRSILEVFRKHERGENA